MLVGMSGAVLIWASVRAEEARVYLETWHVVVAWLGGCFGRMGKVCR